MRNAQRIQTARYALASSLWARGEMPRPADSRIVTELLADIHHYCETQGIDFVRCQRIAAGRFELEKLGDG